MNRKTLFGSLLRRMSALGCLLAVCTSARAQDDVDKYVGQYFDRSIVRNEIRNISIVYGEHESSRFFLRDDASGFIHGGCMKFPLLRGLSVNDFVIHDGNVYFCGSKDDTTAIVGWYNIQGVFENNVAIYTLCEVPHHIASQYWYGGQDDLLEFTRIDVVDRPNGLHMLMLGRGKCTQNGTGILFGDSSWCVADLFYDSTIMQWRLYYSMDYAMWFAYDDFTVTDSNMIVAAHKRVAGFGNSRDYNLLYYHLPDNANPDIFYAYSGGTYGVYGFSVPVWSLPQSSFTASTQSPPDIVIEQIYRNSFATLCFGEIDGVGDQAMVSVYDQLGSLKYRGLFTPQYPEGFREMKYHIYDSSLAFLYVSPQPVVQWIKAPPKGQVVPHVHTKADDDWMWHSLDRRLLKNNKVLLSGRTSEDVGVRAHVALTASSSDCFGWSMAGISSYAKNDDLWDVTHVGIEQYITPVVYESIIQMVSLRTECN